MRKIEITAQQVADYLQGSVEGDPEVLLSNFSSIEKGGKGDLSFLSNSAYEHFLYTTGSSAVLVDRDFEPQEPVHTTLIRVDSAYEALATLLKRLKSHSSVEPGISVLAVVAPTAEIDPTAYVGPLAYVGEHTKVGPGCAIMPQAFVGKDCVLDEHTKVYHQAVVCDHTIIGKRCIIHSGAVIGSDGFGFAPTESGYEKIPQTGRVILEDDVDVGANTCVDRAVLDATILHKGVKVDNLVQLAHNTEVNEHTVIAAQSGIAGSTKIGAWNRFGGQVGVSGHLRTGDRVTFAAQAGVISDVEQEGTYFGSPAQPHFKAMKAAAKYITLPEMDREIVRLRKEVEELKKQLTELKNELPTK